MSDRESAGRSVHLDDVEAVADALAADIRDTVRRFRRTGAIVALSGGIDSSVCVALAVRALGAGRVQGVTLPDKESSAETAGLARLAADSVGVRCRETDITPVLDALGCYDDRLAVVRRLEPGFDPDAGDTFSVEFQPATGDGDRLQTFALNAVRDGQARRHRLGGRDFLTIMAATNQKQRVRTLMTYRIADEENLIVVGTSNRLEIDQGFFVKFGDGCGEAFPLRPLLKTQVYDLAEFLGVPEEIRSRPPTTDTFSAPQSQEEYFYGTSVEMGDALWLAWHEGDDPARVAQRLGLAAGDVEKFFGLYARRAAYAEYLRTTI
ncbi:NAD(+) synthase [Propionicicella superfundia]|uniref:NAD(+) synthase n=1 Tax=Propionicicella superfundia TaxID=348582 RepID=UPI0003F7DA6B|nr:NAD(+) synthase [Propionicicella superfundia]